MGPSTDKQAKDGPPMMTRLGYRLMSIVFGSDACIPLRADLKTDQTKPYSLEQSSPSLIDLSHPEKDGWTACFLGGWWCNTTTNGLQGRKMAGLEGQWGVDGDQDPTLTTWRLTEGHWRRGIERLTRQMVGFLEGMRGMG
uniref:Uncharacterized protein n=1 Tax=Panagrellus redivivus TaxID=6233 RepID=A0A7E4UXD1_PANRE